MAFRDDILDGLTEILSELGETVAYRAAGGKADPIERTVTWEDNPANMPEGIRAVAWGLVSEFPNASAGDLIDRGGNVYKIADAPAPDGYGGLTMNLRQTQKARE